MARQKGIIPLEGTLGGIIFYKSRHGYLARTKGGIDRERIATEPRFARTRETGAEFGYASRVGKLIRYGIKAACGTAESGDTHYRLAARLMQLVQQDSVHGRGQRRLTPDTIGLLEGFEWNEQARLNALLRRPAEVIMDGARGIVRCTIKDFSAGRDLRLPAGATHALLRLAIVAVDDAAATQAQASAAGDPAPLTAGIPEDFSLECSLPVSGPGVLVAGIAIEAFQEAGGKLLKLQEACGFGVLRAEMI
jgi:hypothetical protein